MAVAAAMSADPLSGAEGGEAGIPSFVLMVAAHIDVLEDAESVVGQDRCGTIERK